MNIRHLLRGIDTIDLEIEIQYIEDHYKLTMKSLEEMQNLKREEFKKDLREYGDTSDFDESDRAFYSQLEDHYCEVIEIEIPRLVLGSYIVSLWSLVETVYIRLTELYQIYQDQKLSWNDIKGTLLSKIEKYHDKVLELPFKPVDFDWKIITNFYTIRNAFAHKNGKYEHFNNNDRNEIDKLIKKKYLALDDRRSSLLVDKDYLEETTLKICQLLRDNIEMFNDVKHGSQ